MTNEQLAEIEKLAEADMSEPWSEAESAYVMALQRYALPLVKALREAWEARDVLQAVLNDWQRFGMDREKERDAAQAEMNEFAIAVGYGERPEGQSGVHRLHGEQLADRWKQIERERDEALAEVERLRGIVEVNDRRLAAVWDEARAEVERLKANNQPDQVTE